MLNHEQSLALFFMRIYVPVVCEYAKKTRIVFRVISKAKVSGILSNMLKKTKIRPHFVDFVPLNANLKQTITLFFVKPCVPLDNECTKKTNLILRTIFSGEGQ